MTGQMTTGWLAREAREAGFDVIDGPDVAITRGVADSRLVQPGDLFGAFQGENVDGNAYVTRALEAGAVAAVCERLPDPVPAGRTIVRADATIPALHHLAGRWRDLCGPLVIGITGTVGKTTAKEAIAGTLSTVARVHRSAGNLNSREGLPLALISLRKDDRISVVEMGMDSPGEIAQLAAVAKPDIGIVLNIGMTHAAKLGSIEAIAAEKLSLPRALSSDGTAILNADDERVMAVRDELKCQVITIGHSHDADLRAGSIEDRGLAGVGFVVSWRGQTAEALSPLPGVHTLPAALAAIACCLAIDMDLGAAVTALRDSSISGRLVVRQARGGWSVLDDRYNSSPASLAGALELLASLPGQRIAFLGPMAELGPYEREEHRRLGALAARSCDALFAVGEQARELVAAAKEAGLGEARWFDSKDEAARAVTAATTPGAHILVKASRSQELETVIPILLGEQA